MVNVRLLRRSIEPNIHLPTVHPEINAMSRNRTDNLPLFGKVLYLGDNVDAARERGLRKSLSSVAGTTIPIKQKPAWF